MIMSSHGTIYSFKYERCLHTSLVKILLSTDLNADHHGPTRYFFCIFGGGGEEEEVGYNNEIV